MFCGTTKKLTWKSKQAFFVGLPGLEPGTTGPESAVLPLHHIPMYFYFAGAKLVLFPNKAKDFETFFIKKSKSN